MCVTGPGGSGGCWVGNVVEGPWGTLAWKWHRVREEPPYPGITHLICRGRGGRTKTHRPTAGLTHTNSPWEMHACPLSLSHTHTHTDEHTPEYNILCVVFKYGFKKDYAGDNYGCRTFGGTWSLQRSPTRLCVLIHTVHRYAGKRCQCFSFQRICSPKLQKENIYRQCDGM